ncbi:MAG: hypothetical protein FWD23_17980, partial [Oscillospiraceae bacterium]|nr:hypothetical protein [Oscillospiraceae bacterium]
MKKITKRLFILFCAFVVALLGPAAGLMRHNVTAAGADELISQINAVPGLSAAVSGTNEITVTGSADIGRTRLNLDVDFGVTVKWKANITGAATQNNYAIGLSGGGVFELSGAVLTNTGAGGTVYISGTITLDVGTGGLIESPSSAGSAVTIAGDVKNTIINVGNGGKILSVPGGYAINDGSSFTQCENNTKINVNQNGSLEAGTAGAVRSTGKFSVVTVEAGGLVTSSPASNVSPVISMNCDPPPDSPIENVVINGGTVRTTNSGAMSFVIQTSQSIKVNDGLVQSIAGRAINLVGMNSVATINGGKVTTVSGVAVSVATSTIGKVENAKIEVKGGKVEATGSGDAIHITDVGNTVTVSGGQVVARNGYAIDVEARVSGNPVVVNGGIVFSWGSSISDVINRGGTKLDPIVGGVIADWNTATGFGTAPYHQGESDDLVFLPLGAGVYWDINPESS